MVVFVKPIPSKLNSESTPENLPKPNRRGKDRLPTHHFRGKLTIKLGGCIP